MADRLKELLAKILEWWNRFTAKQKTIIVSIAAAVVFTFAIIIYVFTRPQYVEIMTCDNSAQAAEVVAILESAGVTHRESVDGRTIEVEASQQSIASLAMGSAGFVPDTLNRDVYFSDSIGTTASDRERRWQFYLQDYLQLMFSSLDSVKTVYVFLDIPPQNGTLMAQQEEGGAYIQLELSGTFTSANAVAMAKCAATALGNSNTANITIMDMQGNLLFAGGDDYTAAGVANNLQELRSQAEAMVANQVKRVILATKYFQNADVVSHLDLDFSAYETTLKEYNAPNGTTEGLPAQRDEFQSSSTNGIEGEPGTGSNDSDALNSYVYPNTSSSESSSSEISEKFLQNEKAQYVTTPAGGIIYENSSMSIALIRYREYYEDTVRRQGLLDGTNWENFKIANGADIRLEVDEDYYDMAANATGISRDRITIIAYESPIFYDREGISEESMSNILSIIMILLILGFMAFVVFRGMRPKKAENEEEVEEEEELSVESMLQSTVENSMTIDVETKSDVRIMVEKFVDENPEAAASLLRNWLNEDWT